MKGTLGSLFFAFILYATVPAIATDKQGYEKKAGELCKTQLHARNLCFEAHGKKGTCDDAIYDLDVCVSSSSK